jgi:hypothetical protein
VIELVLTRLSQLAGILGYFCLATEVKLSVCNRGIRETAAVKTLPL